MKKILLLFLMLLISNIINAQLVINEVCLDNDTIEIDGKTPDWIEIYNISSEIVNLKGWYISDKPKKTQKFCFNEDFFINPQETFLIICNEKDKGKNTNFKLSSDGETIVLSNPEGELIDKKEIPSLYEDRSYGRISNGNEKWAEFDEATPGKDNANPKTATPKFSLPAGFYPNIQNIKISCDDQDAEIYYTLDGTEPTINSLRYTQEIKINQTLSLRAIAVKPGYKNSSIATSTYFINLRTINLPIINFTTDDKNFFDNKIGIYVVGTNGIGGSCDSYPKNWNQDWERPIHFEYFDENKQLILDMDAGIKITGTCSRDNDQKSLRIVARKEYGPKRLCYKFFPQKDIEEFKSIVLRSGSNDWCYTKLRDGVATLVGAKNMDIDYQGFKQCVVFFNGRYFGIYNIREKVSDHFIEENYGIDHNDVNLLEDNGKVIEGTNKGYSKNIIDFVNSNDMKDTKNYQKICEHMDINNYIDYWILQLYIDNYDWPSNNIKYWNSDKDSTKWRWIFFGSEYSANLYENDYKGEAKSLVRSLVETNTYFGNHSWGCVLMNKLLENEEFKNNFIQRSAYHINTTLSADNFCRVIDSLKNVIKNEWNYQAQMWHNLNDYNNWNKLVDELKTWYTYRPNNARQHIIDFFNLKDTYKVNVASDCDSTEFYLYDYKVGEKLDGQFFGNVPIKLKAKLPENCEFKYWTINDGNTNQKIDTEELEFTPTSTTFIRLVTNNPSTDINLVDEIQKDITIYPNPTNDIVYINSTDNDISYSVINANGKLLFSGKGTEISIKQLSSGQYFIKVNNKLLKIIKK
ncbi:MAG: CotH kinase family protein [Bacteroidales bacterium]|nr:CotH kinase family protein [Bacteroidales bacterium]